MAGMAAPPLRPRRAVLAALLAAAPAAGLVYSEDRAVQFAKLSGAAYCSDAALRSWTCGPKCIPGVTDITVCHGNTTRAYLARWEDQCLVAFEGTSDVQAWRTDLKFVKTATNWGICGDCRVHTGFLQEWKSLQGCIMELLPTKGCPVGSSIRTTGHSLGAALNGLAMLDLQANGWDISESYDFGMPRTGDEWFAIAYNNLFRDISFRVTHRKDPVPQVPPDEWIAFDWHFMHKEPEVFYGGNVTDGYQICTDPDDDYCSHQYWNLPDDLFNVEDHLDYMGINTGGAGCIGGRGTISREAAGAPATAAGAPATATGLVV